MPDRLRLLVLPAPQDGEVEAMIKIAMIRLMTARLAGQTTRWSNATEREAARRLTAEALHTA